MKCDYFRENIDALLDNELSPAIAEEMWRHRNECAECDAMLEEAENLRSELNALGGRLPPVDFTQHMMKSVREDAKKNKRQGTHRSRKLGWKGVTGIVAAAAALIVCIPLLGGAALGGGAQNYSPMAMPSAAPQATSAPAAAYDMAEMEMAKLYDSAMDSGYSGGSSRNASMPASDDNIMLAGGWGDEAGLMEPESQIMQPEEAGNNEHGLKIIRNGDISLESNSFDMDFQSIIDMITRYEGYTESMSSSGNSYAEPEYRSNRWGNITARIPSQALDAFMRDVGGVGNVTNRSTYSEDVTSRYHDTELQLTTLRTQHERLLELVKQATEVSDLIALEQELQSVQYKIDSLTGSLRSWDARVEYSTVYIYVTEVRAYTSTETDSLGDRMRKALESSVEGVRQLGQNIAVGVTAALPYIGIVLVLAIVVVIIVVIVRAVRRKR